MKIKPYSMEEVRKAQNEHNWERHYSLKKGDIYVEAGAFWGKYAITASIKGCRVILIEPDPYNVATLKQVIKTEKLENVTVVEKAVGSQKGKVDFSINLGGSHISNNGIEVEIDTIDNILDELNVEQVDLLCCDVEGYEINLLLGSHNYLKNRKIKNVAIATYHNPRFRSDAMRLLRHHKFKKLVYEEGIVYGNI